MIVEGIEAWSNG